MPIVRIENGIVKAERDEIEQLLQQVRNQDSIIVRQRLIIAQYAENEDALHQLILIERNKTHNAELSLQGDETTTFFSEGDLYFGRSD